MDQLKGPILYGGAKRYHLGVKDTDHGANSCRIATPPGITVGPNVESPVTETLILFVYLI